MERHCRHFVDPWPPRVRGNNCEVGKISGQVVNRRRMSVPQPRSHSTGHARSHPGGSHIDHHRNPQFVDHFKQPVQSLIVHSEVTHDGMKVKAQHSQIPDRMLDLLHRRLAFERINCRPSVNDSLRMALLHRRHKVVGAGWRANRGFQIKGHENCLYPSAAEILHDLLFALSDPGTVPIFSQCGNVRLLAGDPFLCVGITVNVNNPHATVSPSQRSLHRVWFSGRLSPPASTWKPYQNLIAETPAESQGAREICTWQSLYRKGMSSTDQSSGVRRPATARMRTCVPPGRDQPQECRQRPSLRDAIR